MSKYSQASVLAAELLVNGETNEPVEAWEQATKKTFPSSASLRDKGCPKGAFLGLCNAGLVQGVSSANTKGSKNGEYAMKAVSILKGNRFLVSQPDMLWKKVAGRSKTHNHQMDVVIGLWQAERLV